MGAINYGDVFYQVNRNDRTNLEEHNFLILEAVSKWREGTKEYVYITDRADRETGGPLLHKSIDRMMGNSLVYQIGRGYICRAENKASVVRDIHTESYGFYIKKEDASEEIKTLMRGELKNLRDKIKTLKGTVDKIKEELGDE